jgi:hypothetical protein
MWPEIGFSKIILENDGGDSRIATNPDRFDRLITVLRTAVDNEETLDKESTSVYNYEFEENYDNDNTKSIATYMYSYMAWISQDLLL